MDASSVGIIIAAVLGSGGAGAIVTGWLTKRKTDADALSALSKVWHGELARLEIRVQALEADIAAERAHRRLLEALLIENAIPLPDE